MTKTAEQVRQELWRDGMSIADWAREHQYKVRTVRAVLAGQLKGNRGTGHRIAVQLGLKDGSIRHHA